MNALELVALQARAHPERPALVSRGRTWSYRDLWRGIGLIAAHLHAEGVQRGDLLVLSLLPPEAHFLVMLAATRIGAPTVTVSTGLSSEARAEFAQRFDAKFWISGPRDEAPPPGVHAIAQERIARPLPEGMRPPVMVRGLADELWRITLSSGTTGTAKAIPRTHRQRINAQRHALDAAACGPGESVLVYADIGLSYALSFAHMMLSSGATVMLMNRGGVDECLQLLRSQKPTRLVLTTALAFGLVDRIRAQPQGTALPNSLRSVTVSGSMVPPALLESLETLLCPDVQIIYGASEMGTIARSDPAYRLQHPDGMGRLFAWVDAGAIDDEGKPLPPGEVGMLRFRGDTMALHYMGDDVSTAKAFRDGWFIPGDRGAVFADGHFTLVGRNDDRINVNGVKVDPGPLERAVNEVPGVRECATVAVEDKDGRMVLVLAVVTEEAPDVDKLRAVVRESAGAASTAILRMKSLPKNEAGKVVRAKLAELVRKALPRAT